VQLVLQLPDSLAALSQELPQPLLALALLVWAPLAVPQLYHP
jgi:hypothetical protein